MPTLENIKRFLAIVILICFTLPLCQCSDKPKLAADAVQHSAIAHPAPHDAFVAAQVVTLRNLDDIVLVSAFVWPLALWVACTRARGRLATGIVSAIEVAACATSMAYFFLIIRFWGEVRYGGVLLFTSYAAYLLASSITFILSVRGKSAPQGPRH